MEDLARVIVASVNGREISLASILQQLKQDEILDLVSEAVRCGVLEAAITEFEIHVSDDALQVAADTFREEQGLYNSQSLREWLETRGLSIDDWEERLERNEAMAILRDCVTVDYIQKYFAENHSNFARARIGRIVVDNRAQAEELALQIEDDEADFAELARRYSMDETTRDGGGYVGWVNRDDLGADLARPVFASSAGDVVGPEQTGGAWVLIQVLETASPELNNEVREQIRNNLFADWLDQRIAKATIKVGAGF